VVAAPVTDLLNIKSFFSKAAIKPVVNEQQIKIAPEELRSLDSEFYSS
jgi:hypothetical protein